MKWVYTLVVLGFISFYLWHICRFDTANSTSNDNNSSGILPFYSFSYSIGYLLVLNCMFIKNLYKVNRKILLSTWTFSLFLISLLYSYSHFYSFLIHLNRVFHSILSCSLSFGSYLLVFYILNHDLYRNMNFFVSCHTMTDWFSLSAKPPIILYWYYYFFPQEILFFSQHYLLHHNFSFLTTLYKLGHAMCTWWGMHGKCGICMWYVNNGLKERRNPLHIATS